MPSSSARSTHPTARRLLKLASVGLAGRLAGLLSGRNASPDPPTDPHVSSNADFTHSASQRPDLSASIEARQIPHSITHPRPAAAKTDRRASPVNPSFHPAALAPKACASSLVQGAHSRRSQRA
jgi:hypothetical protein